MVTAELHRAAGALSTMPEDSKKPVTDRRFSAINENDDKRAFFGTRNGTSVELTPVDTYPQTILKLVSPAGIFEEKLYYSHLGFAKILTEYDFDTVLDIGSGSGVCARAFRFLGKDLTTIDIVPSHPTDVNADYLGMSLKRQFDLVWCSHILEHQRNIGAFLDRVFDNLRDDGIAAITVPWALSPMIIGHPNIFTPLHVIYHLVLAGFDCRDARVKSYDWQFTIIVRKRWNGLPKSNVAATHYPLDAPNFHPDLLKFFPVEIPEDGHAWGEVDSINWELRPELAADNPAPVPGVQGDIAGTPDPEPPGPALKRDVPEMGLSPRLDVQPGPNHLIPTQSAPRTEAPIMSDKLAMLPGTRYARYSLPVDYLPSRDLRPRWGYGRPPIPALSDWFSAHIHRFEAFLEEMARSLPQLASIPLHFDTQRLPEPAWFSVPFAPFDSLALYTMVRLLKPQTYLEIGSGISTCFAAKAVRDHNLPTRIVSIDPQPRAAVDAICDEVIREGLETCNLDRFDLLQPGDIVFFDGSHRSFMNSDVTVFMIDVLPRLKPGVVIHIHDVQLPWDYPDMFVDCYWNEQYLLAVYLMAARDRLAPILPTAFVCRDAHFADRLAIPFIDFGDRHLNSGWRGGGSMWFTHKANLPIMGSPKPEDAAAASADEPNLIAWAGGAGGDPIRDLSARARELEDQVARLMDLRGPRYLPDAPRGSTYPPPFDPPVVVDGESLPLPPASLRPGYSPDDDALYLKWGKFDHDFILNIAGRYLDLERPLRILDFRCKSGRVLRHFETERQSAGWHPHGVDPQAAVIEWMRSFWPPVYDVCTTTDAVPALPFGDNYFDIIYGISVFTHIKYQWDSWLCELRRCLKPGGLCLQTVNCEGAWSLYARGEAEWQIAGVPDYVREHPEMDVDSLFFSNSTTSNTFYKRSVVEKMFGRYMPVREILDPPEFSFQDWVVMQKEGLRPELLTDKLAPVREAQPAAPVDGAPDSVK